MSRSEYRRKVEASLERMNDRIADLESRIEEADLMGKSTFEKLLDDVRSKRDTVRAKAGEIGSAADAAWSEFKSGLDGAWTELEASYQKARAEFTRTNSQA